MNAVGAVGAWVRSLMQTEPAAVIGLIVAVLVAFAAFGFTITPDQRDAITGVVAALFVLAGTWGIRQSVYSPASYHAGVKAATGGNNAADPAADPTPAAAP